MTTTRWKQPADAWSEAPPTSDLIVPAVAVGCASFAVAVAVPAVFIVLGSRKPEGLFVFGVGAVVWPVLALSGLFVAPTAGTIGLVLWRRAQRAGQKSRLLHIALILNVAGFAWWLWLALAWIAERA